MNTKDNELNSYKTNQLGINVQKKYESKFELSNTNNISKDKEPKKNNRNQKKRLTRDEEYNDDFLLSFRTRYDDIFKDIKGHEIIFEDLENEHKKEKVSNEIIKGAVFLRKLKFNENIPKIKKKTRKIDIKKIVKIQKIFKGYFVRNIKSKLDRLRLRQCFIELFCLLVYASWDNSKIREYFHILRQVYNASKLDVGNELTFTDKLSFKLPKCFYTGTKINNINSNRLGEEF